MATAQRSKVDLGLVKPKKHTSLKYNVLTSSAFIVIGLIVMYILGNKEGGVWGYGIITFSLVGLLLFESVYLQRQKARQTKSVWSRTWWSIVDLFMHNGPLMLLVICSGWLLAINIAYSDTLSSNSIPSEYNNFQAIGICILLTELFLLHKYLNNEGKIATGDSITAQLYKLMDKNISWLITFFGFIYLLVIGIMQVILQYFTTDG